MWVKTSRQTPLLACTSGEARTAEWRRPAICESDRRSVSQTKMHVVRRQQRQPRARFQHPLAGNRPVQRTIAVRSVDTGLERRWGHTLPGCQIQNNSSPQGRRRRSYEQFRCPSPCGIQLAPWCKCRARDRPDCFPRVGNLHVTWLMMSTTKSESL